MSILRGIFPTRNEPASETSDQALRSERVDWDRDGYLVLKQFFRAEEIQAWNEEMERLLLHRKTLGGNVTIDVLEGEYTGQRMKLQTAPDAAVRAVHKVNDLYLESEGCRTLNLDARLCTVLTRLLGSTPIAINSLSFGKGSQQPHHFDTYYMPPPVQDMMVVSSICLEDQTLESGPLSYYPGSHKIPPYLFSHGGLKAVKDEMPLATDYVMAEIEQRGLKREQFVGQTGDVFIWHSQLYHGGSPILDHNKTRKSLVTHYWRKKDVRWIRTCKAKTGGYYLRRKHADAA